MDRERMMALREGYAPWPSLKRSPTPTTPKKLVRTLRELAAISRKHDTMGWGKETEHAVASIARGIEKGSKANVIRNLAVLTKGKDPVDQGLLNEIQHWIEGWVK